MPTQETHTNVTTGETVVRRPAGGWGGGITSLSSTPATDEQRIELLQNEMNAKAAELEIAKERHETASNEHAELKAEFKNKDNLNPPDINERMVDDKLRGVFTGTETGVDSAGRGQQHPGNPQQVSGAEVRPGVIGQQAAGQNPQQGIPGNQSGPQQGVIRPIV